MRRLDDAEIRGKILHITGICHKIISPKSRWRNSNWDFQPSIKSQFHFICSDCEYYLRLELITTSDVTYNLLHSNMKTLEESESEFAGYA